jgi:sugar-specific transcriptional regulator TrmB
MRQKEWREHLRVEQMKINAQMKINMQEDREEGLVYCEVVVKKCDTLYEQQNAKVQSQLEDLRQKHGAASEEYQKKIKAWKFLSEIKERIENMSGEVINSTENSVWQIPSEDEEEQQEEEFEYRDSVPQACPFGLYLTDEASADEDSADEDSADNPSTDESSPTDESQPTPKRRKMDA